MLNPVAAVEAMYSATYVENYLDSVENLPNDVQRHLTRIREIDLQYRVHLRDVDYYHDQWSNCPANDLESSNVPSKRARAMTRIQQSLISAQELGDEKMHVVNQLQDLIDQKTRQLDSDFKNLDFASKDDPAMMESSPRDTRPNSPSFVPSTSNYSNKVDSNDLPSTSAASASVSVVVGASSNLGLHGGATGSNNGDRNWKRSRRARETGTSRSNSGNNLAGSSKSSQIDLLDSNSTSSNQNRSNQTTNQPNNSLNSSQNRKQSGNNNSASKKRKRKSGRAQSVTGTNQNTSNSNSNQNSRIHDDTPPLDDTIDPDEPTYCLCDQISFGEMILCDNDLCPIEWFHFSCVSLTTKPKGKWFCPNCRGERPSVMKPKQQFLKELERYNREKEEKT